MKKHTTEEIINFINQTDTIKYDFSKFVYKNVLTKVKLICPIHGEFEIWPARILQKKQSKFHICQKCNELSFQKYQETLTEKINGIRYTPEFLKEKLRKYKNIFDINIDKIIDDYKNKRIGALTKISFKCLRCNESYNIILYDLLFKHYTCKKCKRIDRLTQWKNDFLKDAIKKYPNIDYSQVNIDINFKEKITNKHLAKYVIICPIHGKWEVTAKTFLKKGCPRCEIPGIKYQMVNRNYTNDEFIYELKKIYGDLYDYSLVNYINWKTKVKLICKKHGEFLREPIRLIKEHRGCPHCQKSFLEQEIMEFLKSKNIKFTTQYILNLKRLDFYLNDYNVGIECQGRQHFYLNSLYNEKRNISTIEELYKNDINKYNLFFNNGIKIYYYTNFKNITDYFQKLYTNKEELLNKIVLDYESKKFI